MAEAEIGVVGTKVKVVDEEGIILKLKRYEADALSDVLSHIGGDPFRSRRGFVSGIQNALLSAGVRGARDFVIRRDHDLVAAGGDSLWFNSRNDIDYIINNSEEN